MSDSEVKEGCCPQCGASLPAEAPRGLCPACLLKRGLESNTEGPGPHAPFTPPSVDEISPRFPDLEILELLGHGGMGAVYKARQKDLDRTVAVKILPPAVSDDPAFADRFAREAKALARLNHPNIVTIHSSGQTEGLFYFVMEYVDGVHLRKLMQGGRIAPREALAIVPQICDALQYAHDKGIVHRDIKPENILMDRRGNVKVADFGVAKLVETSESAITGPELPELSATEPGRVMGTPQYMAPEQREHPGDVDNRADVYALGVVFYQMLTGELPDKMPVPPSKKVAVDVRLDEVVLRALEREPARRYGQVSEVKTRVEDIAATPPPPETLPIGVAPENAGSPPGPSRFSRPAIWGAVWACFFPILPLAFLVPAVEGAVGRVELVLMLLLFPPGLIALNAPLGTTLLGWVAVRQIRNAPERLHGLGLALFDALMFPLLTINALIAVAGLVLVRMLFSHRLGPIGGILLLCGIVLACVLVSFMVVRRISRWARAPVGNGRPVGEASPPTHAHRVWRRASRQDGSIPADAGTMDREAGRQGAGDQRGARAVWVPVAVTVAWHFLLYLGVAGFFVFFVPKYVAFFDDLEMELPTATLWAIRLAHLFHHAGVLALPLLLALDAGMCWLLQALGGRRLRNLWSALFVLVCVVLVLASAATLYLPFNAATERLAPADSGRSGPNRRGGVPASAHIASSGQTVMVHHRNGQAEYVVYYAGDFNTSGGTTHNTRSLLWYDDFNIHLESGASFGYTRESTGPQKLRINGREYLLLLGRVFVLHDDATVEQLLHFPALETARDPEAIGELANAPWTLSSAVTATVGGLGTSRAAALDLETGRVMAVPASFTQFPKGHDARLAEWMRSQGVHLVASREANRWSVRTVDAGLGRISGEDLESVTRAQLRSAPMTEGQLRFGWGQDLDPDTMHVETTHRFSSPGRELFAFRTLSGRLGAVLMADAEPTTLDIGYRRAVEAGPGEGLEVGGEIVPGASSSKVSFDAPVSITLNHLDMPFANALDLDAGRVLDVPGDLLLSAWTDPRQVEWMQDHGAHVIAAYWTNHWAVKLIDASLAPMPTVDFEKATLSDVRKSAEHASLTRPDGMDVVMSLPVKSLAGLVFAFRTGAGAGGVVLVERAQAAPPALHLRYRRLRDASPAVVRLIGAAASEQRWQWGLESPRPARMVYGLVEVLDDGQHKPLLSGVDGARGHAPRAETLERVIRFRTGGSTNAFLDLDTGVLMTPPPDIARAIEERKG